jgi:hypothetical protein
MRLAAALAVVLVAAASVEAVAARPVIIDFTRSQARFAFDGAARPLTDPGCREISGVSNADGLGQSPPTRVRSTDSGIRMLIKEGRERSMTFRALTESIERSSGIVYVQLGVCAFGHLDGCLLPYLERVQSVRYLRILITPTRRSHDEVIVLIAHELRHALEVLEQPDVVDTTTLDAWYRRNGVPIAGRGMGYETHAARVAGDAVLSELSWNRRK